MIIRFLVKLLFGERHAHTTRIAGDAAWLFMMHCFALGVGFVANFLMVRFAGVENLGGYVYLFNLLYLLTSFCNFGLDTLVLTKTTVYYNAQQGSRLKGLALFAMMIVLGTTSLVIISTNAIPALRQVTTALSANWTYLATAVLLLMLITTIAQASLQSLGKVIQSQLVEKIVKPLLLIIVLVVLYLTIGKLSQQHLVAANLTAIALGAALVLIMSLRQLVPAWKRVPAVFETRSWIKSSFGFYLVAVLYMLNARTDVFMLGLFKPGSAVGIYSIALRMSELIGFALMIINFVLAPITVQLNESGDKAQLQKIITSSARAVLAVGLPLLLTVVFFSEQLLGIFGEEFLVAGTALIILCCGQFINILAGPVELILIMTNNQRFSVISLAAGTAVNIALNLFLAPQYGIVGTALASAASLITWKLLMYVFVRSKTGLRTTAFGRL